LDSVHSKIEEEAADHSRLDEADNLGSRVGQRVDEGVDIDVLKHS